ncbi:pitrilysin [Pasteurellaceae bacterium 15-036681]|nr:pitrilysin [Pasteurellaceae bacterium 15-036681]
MKKSLLAYTLQALFALSVIHTTAFANNAPNLTASNAISQNQQLGFELLKTVINKSPADKAIYQGIKLNNGMEVLLISDEKANKSLMSLALPIGSMEDPIEQQGLAHYLEHMILMGSKAFPETNSLDGFLTKNGGYNNAYTASDRTVYFMEVNHNAFDEAVARYADTFAQPLLSEQNAKKEVNAVNAEMIRAKSNDGFLMQAVNLATANPSHPMTKFAVGNNDTLSDKENSKLQEELVKFHHQYYSANLMKAVLYSNQPIEQMAKLAEQTLGKVENKRIAQPTLDMPFLRTEDKGVMIQYKPVRPSKMLSLSFDMPEDKAEFKHKSGEYLAYIFGNNTEGTLSDYLIKHGLSDSGIQPSSEADISRNSGAFSLYIRLTEKGLAEQDKIISMAFQQIAEIQKAGIQKSYFNELKESLAQEFQHLQTEKNGDYISELASQMLSYPLEHIIDQSFVAESMDEEAINAKLAQMTIDNVRILVVNDKAQTDKKTKYFEAPYSISKISPQQREKWLDFSQNPELKLPELNPYFATDFSLNSTDSSRKMPKLIMQEQGIAVYAMPSHYFINEPKANIAMTFSMTNKSDDLKQSISAVILGYMNNLVQSKIDFQASVAGMDVSLTTAENSIGLSASGYTQHLSKLAKDVLNLFASFELSEDELTQAKQRVFEMLDQAEKDSALRQANRALTNFASYPYFDVDKTRKMVAEVTLQDIQQMREKLLNQSTGLNVLSVGNTSDEQLKDLIGEVEKVVKHNNSAIDYGRYIDIHQSQRKLNYIKQISHEDNALVVAYYPNDYQELEGVSYSILLKDILSRWYFDDLRTDKQLGYAVHATRGSIGKTSGLQFLVQSPTASPKEIMVHNQRFFAESLEKLKAMSAEEFEKYRASLLEQLQFKPESLDQEFAEFVTDFSRGNSKFDRKAQIIELVKGLTQQDIIDFYQKAVIDQKGLVFVSQAIGTKASINQPDELKDFEKVDSIEQLQKEFEVKRY